MDASFSKNISISLPPQIKGAGSSLAELALLIVVCGLFGFFILLPKQSEVSAKQAQLVSVQTDQSKIAEKLAALQAIAKNIKDNPQEIEYLDQALPLDGKVVRLKILMDKMANFSGVVVGDVTVSSAKGDVVIAGDKEMLKNPFAATRTLQKLSGAVYAIGTFPQLKAFLQKLETSGRLLDITDLSLDGASGGNLNLKVSINAYYLAP